VELIFILTLNALSFAAKGQIIFSYIYLRILKKEIFDFEYKHFIDSMNDSFEFIPLSYVFHLYDQA
jgi:hypothetical protein